MDMGDAKEAIDGFSLELARELRIVPQAEVRFAWTQVRDGVAKAIERTGVEFLPEDAYVACTQGTSVLMVASVAGWYVGFVIATPTIGWRGPELHLWIVYNRGERDVLATFQPEIIRYAKSRGCVRLTGSSTRRGWERRILELGWRKTSTQYEIEV